MIKKFLKYIKENNDNESYMFNFWKEIRKIIPKYEESDRIEKKIKIHEEARKKAALGFEKMIDKRISFNEQFFHTGKLEHFCINLVRYIPEVNALEDEYGHWYQLDPDTDILVNTKEKLRMPIEEKYKDRIKNQKKGKRKINDVDPLGEENWEEEDDNDNDIEWVYYDDYSDPW